MPSETSLCRSITAPFCKYNGVDIGSGGDPVVPHAIQIDLPSQEFEQYGHAHDVQYPIQWRGDGRYLPFKDETLNFVYSSHLLEDFEDWAPILNEWIRVLKPQGYLIVMVPDHERFRARVVAGQDDNFAHRHESRVGELTAHMPPGMRVIRDDFYPEDHYNILFIAEKVGASQSS